MVGMMLWEPSGHWTRPVTLKEVSVLHIRFLCARMAQDRRRNPLTERRRLRTAGKKLLRQRVEQVVLPAGASAEALPEGLRPVETLSLRRAIAADWCGELLRFRGENPAGARVLITADALSGEVVRTVTELALRHRYLILKVPFGGEELCRRLRREYGVSIVLNPETRTMSAAASGGLFGMGAGNGWLERIPAGDTDLVFGMLCEEWGLVIALLAVACILTLAWFAVRASRTGRSSFYTIAACAAGSLLVFQTSLNVFGSVDLLPLTGVTFPFVSNGGSAMLSAWGLLAYLKAMDTRADASFAIGRAAERKLDEEAARMAAPAEDAFEKEDGHAED